MKIIANIVIIFSFLVSCQEKSENQYPKASSSEKYSQQGVAEIGQIIFKNNCTLCHGAKGNLRLNGAKDLGASILNTAERIEIITNGKGTMTSFKSQLSAEEIKAVATFTETLNSK